MKSRRIGNPAERRFINDACPHGIIMDVFYFDAFAMKQNYKVY
jgi:hypothetical protein